jgi:hypothetical protein
MRDTVIATTTADAKFSNATMVLVAGGQAWIGTFSGDKIAHHCVNALCCYATVTPA